VIIKHLEKYRELLIAAIGENIYVDNPLAGCNRTQTVAFYHRITQVFREAGFNMREWSSNEMDFNLLAMKDAKAGSTTDVNLLGLRWQPVADTVNCAHMASIEDDLNGMTKRRILSSIRKLYDVFGFLAPVHVKMKLLLQTLHDISPKWDEHFSMELATSWMDLYRELRDASVNTS
jgi:hypothetical protein